jgi:hypothetical protein
VTARTPGARLSLPLTDKAGIYVPRAPDLVAEWRLRS